MKRREFLLSSAAIFAGAPILSDCLAGSAADLKRIRITEVSGFPHVCPRPKLIGKNSHLDIHGRETRDNVLRIRTSAGIEGIGSGRSTPEAARALLGKSLEELWRPGEGILSPLERSDHALFDLVGKALNVPIWKLLGGHGPEWVPVYDGGIYFNDLLPEYQSRGVARVIEEVEESLKTGHRAFKIKVGRGFKWMEREAGFQRDIEVMRSIRRTAGLKARLMADSNNGFDPELTERWFDALADELFWIEEPFPEEVAADLRLKEYFGKKKWKTLIADGESARELAHFDTYVENNAIDVLQPDIRAFGFTLQWSLSRRIAGRPRIRIAPHNWGSFLGFYMQLQLARGIPNFLMAEEDRSESDLFDTSAFEFKEGRVRVPALPGSGLVMRQDVFERKYRESAWSIS